MIRGADTGGLVRRVLAPLGFTVFALLVSAASVQALWARTAALGRACDPGACPFPRLSEAGVRDLSAAGIDPGGYTSVSTLLAMVSVVVPLALGVVVAMRGEGVRRWLLAGFWVAMAFGPVSTFSEWPWARYTITPLAVAGWFWLVAVFPTFSLTPRWAWIPATAATAWAVVTWGVPAVVTAIAHQRTPWHQLVGPVFSVCVAALIVAQLVRARRASSETRRAQGQLLLCLGLVLAFGSVGALLALRPDVWGQGTAAGGIYGQLSAFGATAALIVLAGAGLRNGVYVLNVAIESVLVGGVVLVAAGAAYGAAAVVASQLFTATPAAALAAVATSVALALLFQPLKRGIDRLVYGDQDVATVVAAVTARVAAAEAAVEVLHNALDEFCTRMRWPSARLDPVDHAPVAWRASAEDRSGMGQPAVAVDLWHDQQRVGTLTIALRRGQRTLTRRDRRIISAASSAFATGISVVRLAAVAEDARREALHARERERASLRRRLHDGVGPSLAVASHLVQGVREDLPPSAVEQRALATAEAALADSLAQVRQLSRDLNPPTLEAEGFATAVRDIAADLGIAAVVDGDAVDRLPEEQRVALYRIAIEAVVNAQRHGSAQAVEVQVECTGAGVRMSIADDGIGMAPDAAPGVGIISMRERAQEHGGDVVLEPCQPHGTRVEVLLR